MALIKSIERISLERNTVHGDVRATYCVFRDSRGDAYLQIDTYGSPRRQIPNKTKPDRPIRSGIGCAASGDSRRSSNEELEPLKGSPVRCVCVRTMSNRLFEPR